MQRVNLVVHVTWDDEAKVLVATSNDIPGLVAEAETWDQLRADVQALVPVLLRENRVIEEESASEVPVHLMASELLSLRV